MKLDVECIDDIEISDELEEQIKRKVIYSLINDIVITDINVVEPHDHDTVKLAVSLNCQKEIVISFERAQFNKLHHINPDAIVFYTTKIADVELSDKMLKAIKKNLIRTLEVDSNTEFRRCPEIEIDEIFNYPTDPGKYGVRITYDCPIEGHNTPEMSETFHIRIDPSKFPLDLCKQRHIDYTDIEEQELPEEDLIALEKIDGSDLGIGFIDNGTILIQSRNRVLALLSCWRLMESITIQELYDGQRYDVEMVYRSQARKVIAPLEFFDLEFIIDELVKKIIYISYMLKNTKTFMVFGQLFGSSKHPQKKKSEQSKRLLHTDRVFYSAFDILVDDAHYLQYSDAVDIFEHVGLPYSKILPNPKDIETLQSQYSEELVEGVILKKNATEPKYERTIAKKIAKRGISSP